MSLIVETETDVSFDFDYRNIIERVTEYALDYIKCPYECEINVTLTGNEEIREINRENRNIDSATDVLSFPMLCYETPGDFSFVDENESFYFNPDTGELILGDIVISADKVISQALEFGHSPVRELAFLTAHSMLHLFGFDHMEENERIEMERRQNEILDALKIYR